MTDDQTPEMTEGERLDVLIALVRRFIKYVKLFAIAVFFIFIIAVGLGLQVSTRNRLIDDFKIQQSEFDGTLLRVESTVNQARQASEDAKKAVDDAIAQSQQGSNLDPQAIIEALKAIDRIEKHLCGGECQPGG